MFIITQDEDCIINVDRTDFIQREETYNEETRETMHKIYAQVGYFNNPNNTPKPIVQILGEYETEADAKIAFDKLINYIQFPINPIFKMPPCNTDEDEI